jgi:hypothetical protein
LFAATPFRPFRVFTGKTKENFSLEACGPKLRLLPAFLRRKADENVFGHAPRKFIF